MAKVGGFIYGSLREKCCNCSCKGHTPYLQTFVDNCGCKYYLVNREQLNELWACTVSEPVNLCNKKSRNCEKGECLVCKFVAAFRVALVSNEFYDLVHKEKEPVLWRVYTRYLDNKIAPFLVKIKVEKRI